MRPVGGLEPELTADVGDVRVGEVRDEVPQRVGRPASRSRPRTRRRRSIVSPHGPVLGGDLAAARAVEQLDPRLAGRDRLDELVRAVGRGVRGDDDLELLGGIVEREQVLEPPLDHRLLVVRRR